MSFKDWSSKGILALISPILKDVAFDIAKIGYEEVPLLIAKVSFEASTVDGFTKQERYAYAKARLVAITGKEIGNKYTDKFFDYLIMATVDRFLSKPPVVPPVQPPVPPPVDPPVQPPVPPVNPPTKPPVNDPYYPTLFLIDEELPRDRYRQGDQIWKKGGSKFAIPFLFSQTPFYANATQGAELIEVIN